MIFLFLLTLIVYQKGLKFMTRLAFPSYSKILLLILGLVLLCSPNAAAVDEKEIMAAIQHRHTGFTTLAADYTRVTRTAAMDNIFQSSSKQSAAGVLKFKKPARLRLDQNRPRVEELVSDGQTVWWYIKDEKLVHKYVNVDLYGEMKPLPDFLGGMSSLEGHYQVKVTPASSGKEVNHRLDLKRIDSGSGPTGITAWFRPDNYILAGFRLTSLTGDTTDFTLNNVQLGRNLPDNEFSFRPPAGVQVIEETGGK
jgi:outer membrane lipoprotein-sorting protein